MKFKIENTQVYGYERAIKASGNPMRTVIETSNIDDKDMARAVRLGTTKQGAGHDNFLKGILVQLDVTAPLYWWKEYDTYKVATVANSTSTMHKIHSKKFERSDFSCDRMSDNALKILDNMINYLEEARIKFVETKDKQYWHDMIQLLPSSYNQMRTCTMNYENLINMYESRKNHK